MAIILSLDSSTAVCSAAVHRDGQLLAMKFIDQPNSAASQLAVIAKEVLDEIQLPASGLNGVVVASGPGSYTGLRIAAATAKGLCYALRIPLLAVDSLRVLAAEAKKRLDVQAGDLLCPMIDARRMEVYTSVYDVGLNVVSAIEAKVIDGESFGDLLRDHRMWFFGDGSSKCKSAITHPNALFAEGIQPVASVLGEIGFERYKRGEFESVEAFEPYYLKDFIAKKPNPFF